MILTFLSEVDLFSLSIRYIATNAIDLSLFGNNYPFVHISYNTKSDRATRNHILIVGVQLYASKKYLHAYNTNINRVWSSRIPISRLQNI